MGVMPWRRIAATFAFCALSTVLFSLGPALRMARTVQSHISSSLTRRIIVLNLGGLVALLAGFLYLNQFREGLIDARVQSLQTQGEIIAAAIASSATVDTDAITLDPEKLLKLAPGDDRGQIRLEEQLILALEMLVAHYGTRSGLTKSGGVRHWEASLEIGA